MAEQPPLLCTRPHVSMAHSKVASRSMISSQHRCTPSVLKESTPTRRAGLCNIYSRTLSSGVIHHLPLKSCIASGIAVAFVSFRYRCLPPCMDLVFFIPCSLLSCSPNLKHSETTHRVTFSPTRYQGVHGPSSGKYYHAAGSQMVSYPA